MPLPTRHLVQQLGQFGEGVEHVTSHALDPAHLIAESFLVLLLKQVDTT